MSDKLDEISQNRLTRSDLKWTGLSCVNSFISGEDEGRSEGRLFSRNTLLPPASVGPSSPLMRKKKKRDLMEVMEEEAQELLSYFNHRNVDALLRLTRNTLEMLRKRIHASSLTHFMGGSCVTILLPSAFLGLGLGLVFLSISYIIYIILFLISHKLCLSKTILWRQNKYWNNDAIHFVCILTKLQQPPLCASNSSAFCLSHYFIPTGIFGHKLDTILIMYHTFNVTCIPPAAESDSASHGRSSSQQAIFRVNVILSIPNIAMVPALEEVQQALNRAVECVVSVSKGVGQWSKERISKVGLS